MFGDLLLQWNQTCFPMSLICIVISYAVHLKSEWPHTIFFLMTNLWDILGQSYDKGLKKNFKYTCGEYNILILSQRLHFILKTPCLCKSSLWQHYNPAALAKMLVAIESSEMPWRLCFHITSWDAMHVVIFVTFCHFLDILDAY